MENTGKIELLGDFVKNCPYAREAIDGLEEKVFCCINRIPETDMQAAFLCGVNFVLKQLREELEK